MYLTRWKSPADDRGETLDFNYGLLKSAKTGIRLAQIQPGTGKKAISITLIDAYVSGSQNVPYDALSYTWGDGARTKNIICNGKRLAVTQTLLEALQRFRDLDHEVTLWIDQICICQERIKERNQQVQLMGRIFKGARKVIVWLGDDYDDSKAGMQLARLLLSIARYQPISGLSPTDLEVHGLPRRGHRRWTALSAILKRPWFWRTWVVQEVVLNPNVELVLGAAMLTWDELESIVALLEGPMPRIWQLDQAISASELPFSRINRIRLRHQRVIETPVSPAPIDTRLGDLMFAEPESSLNDDEDGEDDPQLLDLLLMSRGLGATDPRDKIYALLGLGKHDIDPDYSMSPESVFTDFALQTIGVVTDMAARRKAAGLDVSSHHREVRRAWIMISCAGRHNQKLDLLSWVPDWTVSLSARPLVFGARGHSFAAGGDKLEVFDWHHEFGFQLCGKLLDTVAVAGIVHLEHEVHDKISPNPHDLIKQWWEEAEQIALSRAVGSPGSLMNLDAFEALRRNLSICKHGYYISSTSQRGRPNSLLDELDNTPDEALHSASQTLTLGPTRGRVCFVSASGYVGLAPHGTREGDLVFVIMGADIPFILRPFNDGYDLVGEAYVQGVMDGEVMRMEHIPVQDVVIG